MPRSQSSGVVEDGVYEVCDVKYAGEKKEGASDKKPTGPHVTLEVNDEIEISKGRPVDPVGRVIFRHFAKPEKDGEKRKQLKPQQETALTMVKCCEGQRLGATMGFDHQKDKENPKSALHAIIVENAPEKSYDAVACPRQRVIVVQYCYPTYDDDGTRGWTCTGNEKSQNPQTSQNPHGGDVHAQL